MADLSQAQPQSQIASLVSRALSSFNTLVPALEDRRVQASASSNLSRFKLWAGNLGAHRPSGSRSLEYRLRDASLIRNHLISLLDDLCSSVNDTISTIIKDSPLIESQPHDSVTDQLAEYFQEDEVSDESEIEQSLHYIGHVVDCLLRLSMTIANPTPHDQFKSKAGMDAVEYYERWDSQHVGEKFPGAEHKVARRLAKAMAQRRQYFKYREEHTERLAEGLDGPKAGEQATTIASSLPEHLKDDSDFAQNELADLDDGRSETSETSYAPSKPGSEHPQVPPIPKEYADGPFKCPFCHMIVAVDTRSSWKKHIFGDLRPYVCLESTCSTPGHLYLRRHEWIKHMTQEHWKTWHCSFGCDESFQSAKAFRLHISHSHGQRVDYSYLDTLESLSNMHDPAKSQGMCPLCFNFEIKSPKQYGVHVGEHLQHLALFTLPRIGNEEVNQDEETGDIKKVAPSGSYHANDDDDDDDTTDGDNRRRIGESERDDPPSPQGFPRIPIHPYDSRAYYADDGDDARQQWRLQRRDVPRHHLYLYDSRPYYADEGGKATSMTPPSLQGGDDFTIKVSGSVARPQGSETACDEGGDITGSAPSGSGRHNEGLTSGEAKDTLDSKVSRKKGRIAGVRCAACAITGKEVWVIPGRACGYCGTPVST